MDYYDQIKSECPAIADELKGVIDEVMIVFNAQKVTAAEVSGAVERLSEALEKSADEVSAYEVYSKINAIGTVTYTNDSKEKIDAARTAYDNLTATQKSLITNYSVLTSAETKYSELKTVAESQPNNSGQAGDGSIPGNDNQTNGGNESGSQATNTTPAKGKEPITIKKVPSSVKVKAKKNKVTVSWKKIKKNKAGKKLLKQIKSIQVQYSTDKRFKKNVKTKTVGKKKTKVKLKLRKKATYYIRVRYKGSDGFSRWSKVKRVKIKK